MSTIQWRPQVNALTTPQSYRIQYVPRRTVGYEEMAADIAAAHPLYNQELVKALAPLFMEWIQQQLTQGNQVTLQDAYTFRLSFAGRLNSPDDPLPEGDDLLQVNAYPSQPFIRTLRHEAKLERLPMNEKLPLINSTEDTKLKLPDVLYAEGVLRLQGSNLAFDESNATLGCVLTGTESGSQKQSTYAAIANGEILLVPDIPSQTHPWNNEYTVTLTTQYTEHGTPRVGTYRRRLRTPLVVSGFSQPQMQVGILTGDGATAPYMTIIGGTVTANEQVRIQAVLDTRNGYLLVNVLDMQEGGREGAVVTVTANNEYLVEGFTNSALVSIRINVTNYEALMSLIRNTYTGRLVDILELRLP